MSEPVLTYLMPASAAVFVWGLGKTVSEGGDVIPVWEAASMFYWLWSVKNIAMGPLKKDAGIVTFFAGAVSAVTSNVLGYTPPTWIATTTSVLVSLNYGVPFLMLVAGGLDKAFAKFAKMGKSKFFTQVFIGYCGVASLTWGALAWALYSKN
mmetsp:Transcript_94019/g.130565  ORF Transcript_94019/g.130565 Transcript_94019/m.130565 type:complete len:152 (+) Transcript_94019:32-487(+)